MDGQVDTALRPLRGEFLVATIIELAFARAVAEPKLTRRQADALALRVRSVLRGAA